MPHPIAQYRASLFVFIAVCIITSGLTACKYLSPLVYAVVQSSPVLKSTSSGQLVGLDNGGYYAWLGIPYAEPPVGPLRWKAPRVLSAEQTLEVKRFGNHCTQLKPRFENYILMDMDQAGEEDCLYLNVWAPAVSSLNKEAGSLPVMVWIHGGGDIAGSGDINGAELSVRQNVIVVSMNYRLGSFGWLSHKSLRETAETLEDASGNFGTLDIIQSLQWVQDNIREFGGDPNRVTIFGLSAGGWNVFSLLNSPKAKGLFHRAISHSGVPRMASPVYAENYLDDKDPGHAQSSGELLIALLQYDNLAQDRASAKRQVAQMTAGEVAAYLRSKSYRELEDAYDRLAKQYSVVFASREAVTETKLSGSLRLSSPSLPQNNHAVPKLFNDGAVLSKTGFHQSVQQKTINAVPVIFGTTRDESKLFQTMDSAYINVDKGNRQIINVHRYQLVNDYVSRLWKSSGADEPAQSFVDAGYPAFVYRFDWDLLPDDVEGEAIKALYGASHAIDFPFIFGDKKSLFSNHEFSHEDLRLSRALMSYWAEFAYTGNPGKGRGGELPSWQPWPDIEGDELKTMLFNVPDAGGIRMSSIGANRTQVLAQIADDPRVADAKERCQLLHDILDHSHTFMTLAEYHALAGRQCDSGGAK